MPASWSAHCIGRGGYIEEVMPGIDQWGLIVGCFVPVCLLLICSISAVRPPAFVCNVCAPTFVRSANTSLEPRPNTAMTSSAARLICEKCKRSRQKWRWAVQTEGGRCVRAVVAGRCFLLPGGTCAGRGNRRTAGHPPHSRLKYRTQLSWD